MRKISENYIFFKEKTDLKKKVLLKIFDKNVLINIIFVL